MISRIVAAPSLVLAALVSFGAAAQSDYPDKPVTMIVPFPPGGVADITARPLAETMGRILKQPVIVENRAGAGGGVTVCAYAGATIAAAMMSVSKRRFKWSILLLDALSYGVRGEDSGIGLACPGAVSGARRGSFGNIGRRTGAFICVVRT